MGHASALLGCPVGGDAKLADASAARNVPRTSLVSTTCLIGDAKCGLRTAPVPVPLGRPAPSLWGAHPIDRPNVTGRTSRRNVPAGRPAGDGLDGHCLSIQLEPPRALRPRGPSRDGGVVNRPPVAVVDAVGRPRFRQPRLRPQLVADKVHAQQRLHQPAMNPTGRSGLPHPSAAAYLRRDGIDIRGDDGRLDLVGSVVPWGPARTVTRRRVAAESVPPPVSPRTLRRSAVRRPLRACCGPNGGRRDGARLGAPRG